MRDYAITLASADPGATFASLFHNWKARRRAAALLNVPADGLRDLGLSERDVRWAMHLPLRYDPLRALEDCSGGKFHQ